MPTPQLRDSLRDVINAFARATEEVPADRIVPLLNECEEALEHYTQVLSDPASHRPDELLSFSTMQTDFVEILDNLRGQVRMWVAVTIDRICASDLDELEDWFDDHGVAVLRTDSRVVGR